MNTIYGRDGNVYETGIRETNSEPFIQSESVKNELNQLEMQVENLKEQKYSELLRENKQLKEKLDKYENPKDMTLMMMWCTEKVKDKNKQLKGNWNKLKDFCEEATFYYTTGNGEYKTEMMGNARNGIDILNKMQELEKGSR